MSPKMTIKSLIISTALLVLLHRSLAHPIQDEDISETLNYLRTKVDTLDSKLDILLTRSGQSTDNNSTDSGERVTGADFKPAQPLSVERVPIKQGGGNRFIVRLRNTSDGEITFRIFGDFHERAPNDIVEESDGVLAVSVNVNHPSDDFFDLFFQVMDAEYEHVLMLTLKNKPSDPASQNVQDVLLPLLDVSPTKEAVYDPGSNVTVTATLSSSDQSAEDLPRIRKMFSGLDLRSGEFTWLWSDNEVFDIYIYPEEGGKKQESYTMATADHPLSGFLNVYSEVQTMEKSVVTSIQTLRPIIVRPSNQTGPFPPGYLSIVNEQHHEQSSNGRELRVCSSGRECWVDCHAVGEAVTDITVSKVLPAGGVGAVPSARYPPQLMSTGKSVYWKLQPDLETLPSDGITTFRCSAHNSNTGQVAVKLVDVLLEIPGRIDSARSSVLVQPNPTNSNQINITLNCAITGRPLPSVWFYDAKEDRSMRIPTDPDAVIPAGENEGIARKVYTVSPSELREIHENISSGQSAGYACEIIRYFAENEENNAPIYTFDLPDTV
ncbi:hypothetical protein EGW08_018137 [Elysia chlorotica]|uniref:Ig-like domain-containing protein n=1 Tax=Elysia chlorotica TaxID=188477 RepID=A0A433SXR0_ELYCH|nr:hypothetical protein EGW08_018137 [Elysia chlorotica]